MAVALAAPACTAAEPPPPPPGTQPFASAKAYRFLKDSADFDVVDVQRASGLHPSAIDHWRMAPDARFDAVAAYYRAHLPGWSLTTPSSEIRDAEMAVWRSGARAFVVALSSRPSPAGDYKVLIVGRFTR